MTAENSFDIIFFDIQKGGMGDIEAAKATERSEVSYELDESAVNWKPNRANPAMDSSGVQSRLHGVAGQKSIVVPPELEKMTLV